MLRVIFRTLTCKLITLAVVSATNRALCSPVDAGNQARPSCWPRDSSSTGHKAANSVRRRSSLWSSGLASVTEFLKNSDRPMIRDIRSSMSVPLHKLFQTDAFMEMTQCTVQSKLICSLISSEGLLPKKNPPTPPKKIRKIRKKSKNYFWGLKTRIPYLGVKTPRI